MLAAHWGCRVQGQGGQDKWFVCHPRLLVSRTLRLKPGCGGQEQFETEPSIRAQFESGTTGL